MSNDSNASEEIRILAHSSRPVMIGGDEDYDPCSYGEIIHHGNPSGKVAIKSGPDMRYQTIDRLKVGYYKQTVPKSPGCLMPAKSLH